MFVENVKKVMATTNEMQMSMFIILQFPFSVIYQAELQLSYHWHYLIQSLNCLLKSFQASEMNKHMLAYIRNIKKDRWFLGRTESLLTEE